MLVGVLLLLLAVTGVGHTLLVITRSEFFVSRARWDVLTRRLAAETGATSDLSRDDGHQLSSAGGMGIDGFGGRSAPGAF